MTLLDYLPSLHNAAAPRIDVSLTDIADEFRTPTYVLDETDFRRRLQRYRAELPEVEIRYAAKSLLTTDIARWVVQEGAGLDVSSGGELAIALAGGMDPARIVLPRPSASGASSSIHRWKSPICRAWPAGPNLC